ncbi:MAG: hypothetical protein P8Q85_03030, partial [Candidatus Poseidoniaceae archaeon]|nr:hypothetical protein [Candidatus Poseidoniaceae archaeon]
MGGAKAGRMLTATGLMSLLFLSLIAPQAAAMGGEATIESASISIDLSQQIESASFTYTFDVEEQSGQSADITVQSTLSTIAGVLLESINESRTVSMNGVESFSVTFSSVPFGYSIVETTLTGDAGPNSSTHVTSFNRTIQRMVPLDVSVAEGGDFTFTSIDATGLATGNLTVNDGDHVAIQVPILNNGDYDWNGTLSASVTSGGLNEWINTSNVEVLAMSSTVVTLNTSISMTEGVASLSVALNDSGDGDTSDESRLVQFTIAPPPLPMLDGSV